MPEPPRAPFAARPPFIASVSDFIVSDFIVSDDFVSDFIVSDDLVASSALVSLGLADGDVALVSVLASVFVSVVAEPLPLTAPPVVDGLADGEVSFFVSVSVDEGELPL